MIRRPAALVAASALAVAGVFAFAAPANAAPATSWGQFSNAYIDPSVSSVTLENDISGESQLRLPLDKAFTIDLAGHALQATGRTGDAGLGVPVSTQLTIIDSVGGGSLRASGGTAGAGIGGGGNLSAGTIVIRGGTIAASSPNGGAGIGGGSGGAGGSVEISGGSVTATGGTGAAGIGSGSFATAGGTTTISSGVVTASGGTSAPGIGGDGARATVTGGTVTANGGSGAPGIGAATGSFVEFHAAGGTTVAIGGPSGAGIGGGNNAPGTAVRIDSGATVTAQGKNGADALGSGAVVPATGSATISGMLILPVGSTQRVAAETTWRFTGTITNDGTMTVAGTLDGQIVNRGAIRQLSGSSVDASEISVHNYVLVADADNGTQPQTFRVLADTLWNSGQTLPAPIRDGYRFLGWATPDGAEWTGASILTGDTTITAQWERIIVDFTSPVEVSLTGDIAVGSPVTAMITADAVPAPSSYAYQWYIDGEPVDGATDPAFTPRLDDLNAKLAVLVSPVLDGYASASGEAYAAAPVPVGVGSFAERVAVAIEGDASVGRTLTAVVVSDAVPAPESYQYSWYAVVDGQRIEKISNQPTLPLPAEAVGLQVEVVVEPIRPGYEPETGSGTARSTVIEEGTFAGELDVEIDGVPQLGETLSAVVTDTLSPSPYLAYQWYANGLAIAGADGKVLALDEALVGQTISVEINGTRDGYTTATAVTAMPYPVAGPAAIALPIDSVLAGGELLVTGSGFFGTGELTVQLRSTPVTLGTVTPQADGTFAARYIVPTDTAAGEHTIVAMDAAGTDLATAALTVTAPAAAPAPASAGPALAATGLSFDGGLLGLAGVTLLAAGAVLLRRRTLDHDAS